MFFVRFSRFLRTAPAFSAEIGSSELLIFIVVRIRMLPGVDPIFPNSNCDFESSSKKEMAACLSSVELLDSSFIVLAMALVFPMISCMSCRKLIS
jgi:hypothetical protein